MRNVIFTEVCGYPQNRTNTINFMKGGVNMNLDQEIERVKENIDYYEKMLDLMPEDTLLGRMCLEAYLRRDRRKLKKLVEKKNNGNM